MASSKKSLYAALLGNLGIAVTKFVAAGVSGSSAMLAEAIHSLVDTGNAGLMLFGIHRSKLPADGAHPFGRGMEVYFWTFMVAMLVFALGGGISIYEGIKHIAHPEEFGDPTLNYIVLGIAMVFEAGAWLVAWKEFGHMRRGRSIWRTIVLSKDPTGFAVLLEDSAAMLGLIVAFVGIYLGHTLHLPVLDGVASLVIGIILCLVAIVLARETKGLLVGESADIEVVESIRSIAESQDGVTRVVSLLTLHLGPYDVLLNMGIRFPDELSAPQVEQVIERLEAAVQAAHPDVNRIFIEADSLARRARRASDA